MLRTSEQEDPQHDEHGPYDDAPAELFPSQEEDGEEEHKERGRPG